MRPVSSLLRLAGVALVLPLAASCAKLPPSPVPAALSDREAESMARTYLSDHDVDNVQLHSIRPGKSGYLVAYQTTYEEGQLPPKTWRLVDVNNDGEVRALEFRKNR